MNRTPVGVYSLCAATFAAVVGFLPTFVLVSSASAVVVPVLTPVANPPGMPFLAPDAGLGPDWISYQLSIQSTAGEYIQAIDARIYGQLHQRWEDSDGDNAIDASPNGAIADGKGDSHITASGNIIFGLLPTENNSGNGSPLSDVPGVIDYGVGGAMRAAWGYIGNSTHTFADVAYFVVPRVPTADFKFHVEAANSLGDIIARLDSECPGYVCSAPNIDLVGNGYNVADGDATPNALDGTDFGNVPVGSAQNREFAIYNAGVGNLILGSVTATWPFSAAQNPFDRNRFSIHLNTSVPGEYFGSISFSTNDPLAPVFNFNVAARVVPEPACVALVGSMLIGLAFVRRRSVCSILLRSTAMTGNRALFAALVCLMIVAAPVEAAVVGTLTKMRDPSIGIPFAAPEAALPSPWVSYTVGLKSTTGEEIAAVDVSISGSFHQRWVVDVDTETFVSTPNSTLQSNGDSHLLAGPAALFAVGPSEDNSGLGSPLPDTPARDYGLGTFLRGAWGIPPVQRATYANIAYLVVPGGAEPFLDISVKVANPVGDIIGDLNRFDFTEEHASARISGNGLIIAAGDSTPSSDDGTDFGAVPLHSTQLRTFTITNLGTVPVSLGLPTFSGPFFLDGDFPSTIGAANSLNFTVSLDTSSPGAFLGSMSFGSNAFRSGGPFNFSLAGQVIPEPATVICLCWAVLCSVAQIRWRSYVAAWRLTVRTAGDLLAVDQNGW